MGKPALARNVFVPSLLSMRVMVPTATPALSFIDVLRCRHDHASQNRHAGCLGEADKSHGIGAPHRDMHPIGKATARTLPKLAVALWAEVTAGATRLPFGGAPAGQSGLRRMCGGELARGLWVVDCCEVWGHRRTSTPSVTARVRAASICRHEEVGGEADNVAALIARGEVGPAAGSDVDAEAAWVLVGRVGFLAIHSWRTFSIRGPSANEAGQIPRAARLTASKSTLSRRKYEVMMPTLVFP